MDNSLLMAALQYRCHRCNVIVDSICDQIEKIDAIFLDYMMDLAVSRQSRFLMTHGSKAYDTHNCPDGGIGVLELAGYTP
jgi:hypothetical protein